MLYKLKLLSPTSKVGKRNRKREATIKYDTEDEGINHILIIVRSS